MVHDVSHVRPLDGVQLPERAETLGSQLARELKREKAIMGVFDEGCMGMFNAIVPDHLLNQTGVFKERLSQSSLYAAMREVRARKRRRSQMAREKGLKFQTGSQSGDGSDRRPDSRSVPNVCCRVADCDEFGCETIGIQYQQGLKDLAQLPTWSEGLLNNSDRPPVQSTAMAGRFSMDSHCRISMKWTSARSDGVVTNRIWNALGLPPETTLHDLRYGEEFSGEFVWVFEISGGCAAGASCEWLSPVRLANDSRRCTSGWGVDR